MLKKAELKMIRTMFSENQGHELRLTDEAVSAIVEKIGEDWDEMDGDEQMELFVNGEKAFQGIAIADPSITGIVNRFDQAFNDVLKADIDATIKAKGTAVDVLAEFMKRFSAAEMDAFPYPGFDTDDVKGTNWKPDIVERKAVAGGTIRTVFTDDLVAALPIGKAYQTDIDDVKKHTATNGSPVTRLKDKSKKELNSLLASATQARNALRAMIRRAIALNHQLRAIEGMPKVSFQWIEGHDKAKCPFMPSEYGQSKNGQLVSQTPKPLWIMPRDPTTGRDKASDGRDFSVTQVLAFNIKEAIAKGGTLGDLVDSAKQEPVTLENTVLTPEQQDDTLVVLWANLSKRDEMVAFRKRVFAPNNADLREAVHALTLLLLPIHRQDETWYEAHIGGTKADAEKADAAERTAKALAKAS